jgi:hypothetical protein
MSQNAVIEATLEELLDDQVTKIMMNRDGVTANDIRLLFANMRHRLFEPSLFEPMAADH